MVYKWKEHAAFRIDVDPSVVGKRFEYIEKTRGKLVPATVLEDAQDTKSPLHELFEWNNTRAAEQYRIQQAGYLIRSLEVVVKTGKSEERPVRAYVSVSEDKERHYEPIVSALTDPKYRNQVLDRAFKEFEAFERKYKDFEELALIFEAAAKVKAARKKVQPKKRARVRA